MGGPNPTFLVVIVVVAIFTSLAAYQGYFDFEEEPVIQIVQDPGVVEGYVRGYYIDRFNNVRLGLVKTSENSMKINQGKWVSGFVLDLRNSTNVHTAILVPKVNNKDLRFVLYKG